MRHVSRWEQYHPKPFTSARNPIEKPEETEPSKQDSVLCKPYEHVHSQHQKGKEQSHQTTSYAGIPQRKLATGGSRPGLEREQPSMKAVTVKSGEVEDIKSKFLWGG